MYSLGIETSHKFLLLVLMDDEKVVDYIQYECLKKQSEYIIPEIDNLLNRNSLTVEDVTNIVVTIGPGSYTGVRIGLTVAKILGSIAKKRVYTLSSLQLYAGLNDCYSFIDARANRVYVGRYCNGHPLMKDTVYENTTMQQVIDQEVESLAFIGDWHLFNGVDYYPTLAENFLKLRACWRKADSIDLLTPTYLKSSEEYLRK